MSKKLWATLIIFFLAVSIGSGIFLFQALKNKSVKEVTLKAVTKSPPIDKVEKPIQKVEISTVTEKAGPESEPAKPQKTAEVTPKQGLPTRNILFSYHNSRAKEVFIVGDFNSWTKQPLKKAAKTWKTSLKMSPGSYEYQFIVDGKKIPDPNNRQISKEGKSLLVVKPLRSK